MNYSFMIEADYPPGTIIILNNEDPPYAPIRHKIHRVTHIVPTEPFLNKEVIAIDLSHVPEYAEQMQMFIVEMHRGIQEKRVATWNEQERLRAAAAPEDHVPVVRGGSPGFRLSRRIPQASAPLSDNARFEQFQTDINRERAENIRLIRQEQTRRRGEAAEVWQERERMRSALNPDEPNNPVPMGRVLVPQGGRKSRRGRKSKKSRKRRSRRRGRR